MTKLVPLEFEHDGRRFEAQLAMPAGDGPHPAVLVMANAHGLNQQSRDSAERLAELGYAALATDMYGDGLSLTDPEKARPVIHDLMAEPQELRARAAANLAALRAVAGVDPQRVGAIGYCFGGHCVLELARSGADVAVVVSYHGLLRTQAPARPGAIKAHVAVFTGMQDPYAPPEDAVGLRAEMTAGGIL